MCTSAETPKQVNLSISIESPRRMQKISPHIHTMARFGVSAYVRRKLTATIMIVCIFLRMYTEKPLATVTILRIYAYMYNDDIWCFHIQTQKRTPLLYYDFAHICKLAKFVDSADMHRNSSPKLV